MRSVTLRRLIPIALTIAAAASVAIAYRYHGVLSTSGLAAQTWAGSGFRGSPILQTRDALLRFETAQAKAAYAGGPSSTEWRGYLIVPASGSYRFVVIADDRASVEIERHEIAGSTGHLGAARIELGRGLHHIRVRYEDDGGQQMMEVLWARGNGSPASIPPLLLVPELRSFRDVRERQILAWLMPTVPTFWSVVLLAAAAASVRALVRHFAVSSDAWFVRLIIAVSAVTLTLGIWWGLPDFYGWAPDELAPLDVTDALARGFSGGWATIYPPLHYAVLLAFTSPFRVLSYLGLVDPGHLHVNTAIFVVQRLVSVVMALGTVGLVYAIGSAMSPRAGAFAAATVSVALPFAVLREARQCRRPLRVLVHVVDVVLFADAPERFAGGFIAVRRRRGRRNRHERSGLRLLRAPCSGHHCVRRSSPAPDNLAGADACGRRFDGCGRYHQPACVRQRALQLPGLSRTSTNHYRPWQPEFSHVRPYVLGSGSDVSRCALAIGHGDELAAVRRRHRCQRDCLARADHNRPAAAPAVAVGTTSRSSRS